MTEQEKAACKWFNKCILVLLVAIGGAVLIFWIIDPYFHFHKPIRFISYRLYYERYINDGISRHFDYDAIITGTSMAQNFKTSEADILFEVSSVKETFSGAGYKELSENLDRALKHNNNLKTIIWTMDFNALIRDKDLGAYDEYPTYLYDDNPWNDVSYIFNKSIWYHGVLQNVSRTISGEPSTTFDEYSSWEKETGLEYIMVTYIRPEEKAEMAEGLTDDERVMVEQNVRQNFVDLANKYPDTTFYVFYTPYSICYWDELNQQGRMMMQFDAELIATELLIKCPNVKLFNFFDKYDIITNLSNYRDKEHYCSRINTKILEWIAAGEGIVTKDNYMERFEKEKDYFLNYDYESIYRDNSQTAD